VPHPHRYSATQTIEADARALWGKEEVFAVKSSLYVEMRESNKNAPYTFKEVSHTHLSYDRSSPSSLPVVLTQLCSAGAGRAQILAQVRALAIVPPARTTPPLNRLSISRLSGRGHRALLLTPSAGLARRCKAAKRLQTTKSVDSQVAEVIDKREQSITFDPSWLVNLSEKILLETKGSGLVCPSSSRIALTSPVPVDRLSRTSAQNHTTRVHAGQGDADGCAAVPSAIEQH
jgi:hypothetical protein